MSEPFDRPASREDAERELARLRGYDGRATPMAQFPDRVLVQLRDERISFLHGYLTATS